MTLKDSTADLAAGIAQAPPQQCSGKAPECTVANATTIHPANAGKRQWIKPEYKSINCGSEVTGYFYQG